MWTAGGVVGSIIYLLGEPDTLSASVSGSVDGQWAVFSAEVSRRLAKAWVAPAVGRSSERVLGASNV